MFKTILKAISAVVISVIALFLTSFFIGYLRGVFDPKYLTENQYVEPLNILGLVFIILAVKLPSIVMDFRPGKADFQNKMVIITIVIGLFVIFNLFAGELVKVFLDKVIPALSLTLYKEVGVWEALFLILIFNIVKDQFD
jgi:hypothetical protein